MVDFISEVQEELRKDDYNKWLRRYGPYVVGLIIAVLMIVSFLEWRDADRAAKARAASVEYVQASDLAEAGDVDGALAAFLRFSETAPNGYAGLALMRAAAIQTELENRAEAVSLLDRASERFDHDRHSHLARLKAAYLLSADGRHADAQARLGPLVAEGSPYEFLARELNAYAALSQGDTAAARSEFSYLSTVPGVTPTVAERAAQTLSLIEADESVPPPADATPDATPDIAPDMTDDIVGTDDDTPPPASAE